MVFKSCLRIFDLVVLGKFNKLIFYWGCNGTPCIFCRPYCPLSLYCMPLFLRVREKEGKGD